ncbi:MAG TPA: electron transfer flavoprotein subunit beta/FixA family protein [bacterium]|nr:electron transfer flavoprotein subunit beta/FixA family protein [bacterium]HQI49861.1 electron transfer flavoprotein subunit beta/FixA family protein [bacterium]HQJ65878.1 electron transfer flavoprotein subunit beta/FixA family protein [bacterium]
MKILVLIKQVPDTEALIKPAADGKSIAETGIKYILNPYDEYALEEALRIKEAYPGTTVLAVTLGPARSAEALRSAAAMGADEVLLLKADSVPSDGLATARALATALASHSPDLILTGKEAIDDGNMQVGPMVAELLNLPCLTVVTRLTLTGGMLTAECEADTGTMVFQAPLPAVITCQKGLNEPRYPSIRGKMAAMKMVIPERSITLESGQIRITRLLQPPVRSGGKKVGEGPAVVPELVRLLHSEAKVL